MECVKGVRFFPPGRGKLLEASGSVWKKLLLAWQGYVFPSGDVDALADALVKIGGVSAEEDSEFLLGEWHSDGESKSQHNNSNSISATASIKRAAAAAAGVSSSDEVRALARVVICLSSAACPPIEHVTPPYCTAGPVVDTLPPGAVLGYRCLHFLGVRASQHRAPSAAGGSLPPGG